MIPPPKPKSYSSEDLDRHLIRQENQHLKEAVDNLANSVNAHQTEIHNLTVIIQSLSVKIADISDLYIKIGIPTILTMIGSVLVHFLWK